MTDNLKRKRPEDPTKININQEWEIEYWTNTLDCTREELIRAVEKVGVLVVDVKKEVK